MNVDQLVTRREQLLGPGNPLFYERPLHLVRGEGVWLYDADGQRYLDCYNNVPTVGHCHPRVVEAICNQAGTLNTHTRYLHEGILEYAERLLDTFGDGLDRLLLACTGSEANDVALRMAKLHSGGEGIICTDATYHGNTTAVSQLSTIFEPPEGYDPGIRRVPWPDTYRTPVGVGQEELADGYADHVDAAIESLQSAGIKLAAMVVCPIFANEGLPEPLPGYLQRAAQSVRSAGGLLIADEVQSGFGRTGSMWGHTHANTVPDIVTLGKPMGNGHPISGLVTRGELMDEFRERVMYFNTFGGNPVSCAAASAVLDVLHGDGLVDNAGDVGGYLLNRLRDLMNRHECVGDVRGRGLFFGIDLVTDRASKTPAAEEAGRVVNDLREHGVLISRIGAHDNVLKLRPPLCFSRENADQVFDALDAALGRLNE